MPDTAKRSHVQTMSDTAIRVENLSKLYHIGKAQRRHDTLRDAIVDSFKRWNVRTLER